MEAKFYKHDSYLEMRRKFTGAWANLRLELHRQSLRFYKEGDDEFEINMQFFPPEVANELLFTLTGDTTKAVARKLFSDCYSYRAKPGDWVYASIEGNFPDKLSYFSETDTLDECNNPFYLPFNEFVYADFKRRFANHWTNLSVEIFQKEKSTEEPKELSDDFEMKNLKNVNRLLMRDYYELDGVRDVLEKLDNSTTLRDEVYLSSLVETLERSNVFFRIKNEKLGIYWERKLNYPQLKNFQAAEFTEENRSE